MFKYASLIRTLDNSVDNSRLTPATVITVRSMCQEGKQFKKTKNTWPNLIWLDTVTLQFSNNICDAAATAAAAK